MNSTEIKLFYTSRTSKYKDQEVRLGIKDRQLSLFRMVWFVLMLIGIVWLANARVFDGMFGVGIFGLMVFVFCIRYHHKVKFQYQYSKALRKINEMELNRLEGNDMHFQYQSRSFVDAKHPYSSDLDIFGEKSLFQWICRSETISGQRKLATFLQKAASKKEIIKRQKAAQELAQNTDFRHAFQAHGRCFQRVKKMPYFKNPFHKEHIILHDKRLYIASITLPILFVFSVVGVFFGSPYGLILLVLILNGIVLRKKHTQITEMIQETTKNMSELQAFSKLSQIIEKQTFESELLCEIQQSLHHKNTVASSVIHQLKSIIEWLEFRNNAFFYVFVNLTFLWEIHQMRRFERLKAKYQHEWKIWFDAVAQMDALNSFGGLAFSFPSFSFPQISETPYHFEAQDLGHPLIFPIEHRVCNTFSMQGNHVCNLITGSNMSGKSTFLRTVAINMVLAFAGAPVCASKLQVSTHQIFTSMRTQDSLSESISSFYAELKRIRQLLDIIERGDTVFYFLDEILKGTNSDDRRRGGQAIIQQLQHYGVSGFISTHDLDLGKQADTLPETVRNFSFNSQIINDELQFDYHISEGLCQSFNASVLMKNMGIRLDI